MRILVVSDTHGSEGSLRRALLSQPTAEIVIHLGDGEAEAERLKRSFPEKMFLQVRGNCDLGSSLPRENTFTVDQEGRDSVKIFYTHGDLYGVKYGFREVKDTARDRKANVLLFGHTHEAFTDYDDGLYIMNPGSLSLGNPDRSYGILDLTPQGIVTNVIKMP